jgi:hypothetical protein
MITGFTMASVLDLYHLHLMYDTVSFVGVSNAAALVCWSFCNAKMAAAHEKAFDGQKKERKWAFLLTGRYRVTYVFAIIFLALTVLLGARLNEWAPDAEPGRCYNSYLLSSGTSHPGPDKTYLGITSTWLLAVMFSSVVAGVQHRRWVLTLSFLQFPVHLYAMIALRVANSHLLDGPETENGWDFGQTTSILMLAFAISEVLSKGWAHFIFERDLARKKRQNEMENLHASSEKRAEEGDVQGKDELPHE